MDMVYTKRMEDFILQLWVDGLIEDFPIIDEIAKRRQLTDYIKRVRDSHDELVNKLMEGLSSPENVETRGKC